MNAVAIRQALAPGAERDQLTAALRRPLIVDLFCGGGGAAEGIRQALGVGPSVAVDTDVQVLSVHEANHEAARHINESVWDVNPREVSGGQSPALLWLSPSCTEFSQAKAGKPRNPRILNLAWIAAWWAATVCPEVIAVENVPGLLNWGPLLPNGLPDPTRKGESFNRWVARLRSLGYSLEWRELDAADYGAATHRERLFIIMRRDGQPVAWPAPTHGPDCALPHVGVGEVLDWERTGEPVKGRKSQLSLSPQGKLAVALRRAAELAPNGNHAAIMPYQGREENSGRAISRPIYTLMTTENEALVQGAPDGTIYHRMLSIGEAAQAQGFPRGYRWVGTKTACRRVVGNSVSPIIARALIACVVLGVTPGVAHRLWQARDGAFGPRRLALVAAAELVETAGDRREVKVAVVVEVEAALDRLMQARA